MSAFYCSPGTHKYTVLLFGYMLERMDASIHIYCSMGSKAYFKTIIFQITDIFKGCNPISLYKDLFL